MITNICIVDKCRVDYVAVDHITIRPSGLCVADLTFWMAPHHYRVMNRNLIAWTSLYYYNNNYY